MDQQANLDQARKAIELFHSGQLDVMRQMMTEDVVWRLPRLHPLSADIVGIDNVIDFFKRVQEETDHTFRGEVLDLLANQQLVVAVMRVTADRDGKHFDQRVVNLWKLNADGKVYEREAFFEDPASANEFWMF